jgi:tRNA A-37 threonylcarbamoyl transferase component Bud32
MKTFGGEQWNVPDRVHLMPDLGQVTMTGSRLIQTTLEESIPKLEQVYWLTDKAPETGHGHIYGSRFENNEEWLEGRRDSIQGVFFGYIALGNEIETPVAVKPFLSNLKYGVHETALLMHLQKKGLPVYEVLGAAWSKDQGYTMITKFEEDSKSLDNIVWRKGIEAPLSDHLTNLEAIKQVGRTLGLLHGNGIIHGDAQIKNFAVNGDEVRIVDLAGARVVADESSVDEVKLRIGMYEDVMLFLDSLKSRGFIGDGTIDQKLSFFDSSIATSYRSGLFEAEGHVRDKVRLKEIVDDVIRKAKAEIIDSY